MDKKTTQTDVNKRKLLTAASYEKAKITNMLEADLSTALTKLFTTHNTNASKIATITGLSRSYVTELQTNKRDHKNPNRQKIISICLAANASIDETDHVLKAIGLRELYARDEVDALIIWALAHKKNFYQIIELLQDHGHGDYLNWD